MSSQLQNKGESVIEKDHHCYPQRVDREAVELVQRNRDLDMDTRILCGEIDASALVVVRRKESRNVSFLLSSTFDDTEIERNLALADVVAYLQEVSRKLGFEFRLVEMRLGIRAEASSSHQTSEICMAELERCQRES